MGNKNLKLWLVIALASLAVVGGSLWMFTSKSTGTLKGDLRVDPRNSLSAYDITFPPVAAAQRVPANQTIPINGPFVDALKFNVHYEVSDNMPIVNWDLKAYRVYAQVVTEGNATTIQDQDISMQLFLEGEPYSNVIPYRAADRNSTITFESINNELAALSPNSTYNFVLKVKAANRQIGGRRFKLKVLGSEVYLRRAIDQVALYGYGQGVETQSSQFTIEAQRPAADEAAQAGGGGVRGGVEVVKPAQPAAGNLILGSNDYVEVAKLSVPALDHNVTINRIKVSMQRGPGANQINGNSVSVQLFKVNRNGASEALADPTLVGDVAEGRWVNINKPLSQNSAPYTIVLKAKVNAGAGAGRSFALGVATNQDIDFSGDEPSPRGSFPMYGNQFTTANQAGAGAAGGGAAAEEPVQVVRQEGAQQDVPDSGAAQGGVRVNQNPAADGVVVNRREPGDDRPLQQAQPTLGAVAQVDPNASGNLILNGGATLDQILCPVSAQNRFPEVKKGATGDYVILLQQEINAVNKTRLAIDGTFGQNVENEVRKFQLAQRIPVTGIVNQQTWTAFETATRTFCNGANAESNSRHALVLSPNSPSQNNFTYDQQSFEVARFTFTPTAQTKINNFTLKSKPGLANPLPVNSMRLTVHFNRTTDPFPEERVLNSGQIFTLDANGEKRLTANDTIFQKDTSYEIILRGQIQNIPYDQIAGKKLALGFSAMTFTPSTQRLSSVLPIYGNEITLPVLEIRQPVSVQTSALPDNPLNGQFFEFGKIIITATNGLTVGTTKLHLNPVANSVDKSDIEVKLTRKQRNAATSDMSTALQFNAQNTAEFRSGNGGELIAGQRVYDNTQTEYIGVNIRVLNPDRVRGKMLSLGLTSADDMQLLPPGSVLSGAFPAFSEAVAIQERQRSAHGIAAAADMPAGQNMNPGGSFVTVGSFTLTPRRVVRANGITVSIQPTAAFTTSDVEAQLFVINENGAETAFTEIRAFDAASNNIVFGEQNGMSQSVLFDPPEVAHKIIIKVRVKNGSSADAASFRVGITGAHDMSFTTLEETEAGLTGTPVLSNSVTITVPHPAAEDPVDDVVLNEDPVPAETCESHGQFTYDGPERPGVRIVGMCIPCPTETYIAFGGACEAPQAEVTDDVAPAADDSGNGDMREAAPDLGQTQRIVRAPERGRTGPGLIPYIVTVGAANLAFFLNKGRRKRKHK